MEKISFVIPCYKSGNTIQSVVEDIVCQMDIMNEYDYEILLINDCSPDYVWKVISSLCEKNTRIKAISLAKNFGQHSALMAGYNYCEGDYVVTLDDDGQTPVNQVPLLLNKLLEGYDVVYADYFDRKDKTARKIGTWLNNLMLTKLLGKPKDIRITSFFVCRKYIVKEICEYRNAFPYIWGLVLRTTNNIANASITHRERMEGETGYTFQKLVALWMNGFTAFSVVPLRLASLLGCFFTACGGIGILYVVITKLLNPEIAAGYSSLMTILLFIGGMLMISLGLIGEYIGRIYMCINDTPQFVVCETKNLD